jgi:type I restriction enzyme M protein
VNESVLGAIISSEVFRIPLNSNVIPEYVALWLNTPIAQSVFDRIKTGGIMGHITQEVLRNVFVPVPDKSIQEKIVETFHQSDTKKAAKEREARELLASVDAFVLEKLGIRLPDASDNSLRRRAFYADFNQLSGGRFDPDYISYLERTASHKYPTFPFKQLLTKSPQYGANEIGIERTDETQPRYIRITDIDEWGNLIENDLGKTTATIEAKYILQNNDLLFARSGNTVGKCYLHKADLINYECFFAGYMIRFVVDENQVLPDYVFCLTQTTLYKDWVSAIRRAAGQPNINAEEYKSFLIPLPPPDVQEEIAAGVSEIYRRAKLLRAEGAEIVAEARREVEKMILGES